MLPQPQHKSGNGNLDLGVMRDLTRIAEGVRAEKSGQTRKGCAGLCFDWNLSLAKAIREEFDGVRFIYGKFRTDAPGEKHMCVHYWAEVGDFTVDITGTQFNKLIPATEALPPVLVIPTTERSNRYIPEEDQTDLRMRFA